MTSTYSPLRTSTMNLTPATVRADLKCGNGAISKGEKCHVGTVQSGGKPAVGAASRKERALKIAGTLGSAAGMGYGLYAITRGNIRNAHAGFAASNAAGSALNYGRSMEEERKGNKKKAKQFRNSAKVGLAFAGLNAAQAYSTRHMTGFKSRGAAGGYGGGGRRPGSNKAVKDPFKDLGVNPRATDAEIKKAWLNNMRKHHPDVGGDPEIAKKANAAYQEILRRRGIKDADFDAVFDADLDSVWAYGFQP